MPVPDFYKREHFAKMSREEIKQAAKLHNFRLEDLVDRGFIDQQQYNELNQVSEEEHYYNIIHRRSRPDLEETYTKKYIKELLLANKIDEQLLTSRGIFSDIELADIRDDHYYLISSGNLNGELASRYSDNYIRQLILSGQLSEQQLKSGDRPVFTQARLDEIMKRPVTALEYRNSITLMNELPQLLDNRVDVFVLGVVGSGKSSFLSGVLKAAKDTGNLDLQVIEDASGNVITKHGYGYAHHLINSLERKLPAASTSYEFLTYVPVNFRDDAQKEHPLSFMEMSGELFQECYMKNKSELHTKLQTYLFGDNQKIIMCVVDYDLYNARRVLDTEQWQHFDWFLKLLDTNKTLARCISISIVITKWDLSPDQSLTGAQNFVENEYLSLYKICERLATKYKLNFKVMTFSLGDFDERNAVVYRRKDSEKVLDWFVNMTPHIAPKKKWF